MSENTKQADPASVRQDQLVSLRWWVRGWYRLGSQCCIRGPFDRVNEVGEREDKARLRLELAKQANAPASAIGQEGEQ